MSYLPTVNELLPSVDELPGNVKGPFPAKNGFTGYKQRYKGAFRVLFFLLTHYQGEGASSPG